MFISSDGSFRVIATFFEFWHSVPIVNDTAIVTVATKKGKFGAMIVFQVECWLSSASGAGH